VGEVVSMMLSFQRMSIALKNKLNQEASGASILGDGLVNHHNLKGKRELEKRLSFYNFWAPLMLKQFKHGLGIWPCVLH
jgi:hypothetical protein